MKPKCNSAVQAGCDRKRAVAAFLHCHTTVRNQVRSDRHEALPLSIFAIALLLTWLQLACRFIPQCLTPA